MIYIYPPKNSEDDTAYELPDLIKCVCSETANSSFEIEGSYPVTGENYRQITEGAVISGVCDMLGNVKNFMIKEISRPIGGVITFHAYHEMYEILTGICRGSTAESTGTTATQICNYLYTESGHSQNVLGAATFSTDISDSVENTFEYKKPTTLKRVLNDAAALFGGIWDFYNRAAVLKAHRGTDRGFTAQYGLNLKDFNSVRSYVDRYTHVCPYWTGKTTVNGVMTETTVYLSEMYVPVYGAAQAYTLPYLYDCSKIFIMQPTETELRAEAQNFILDPANAETLGKNYTNITFDYVALKKTAEYINDPNRTADDDIVAIGDTVTVIDKNNTEYRMIVTSIRYDMLRQRCESVTVGFPEQAVSRTRRLLRAASGNGAAAVTGTVQNTSYTIARLMQKQETPETSETEEIPDRVVKVSDSEVYEIIGNKKITWQADGTGNERHNFRRTIEVITV